MKIGSVYEDHRPSSSAYVDVHDPPVAMTHAPSASSNRLADREPATTEIRSLPDEMERLRCSTDRAVVRRTAPPANDLEGATVDRPEDLEELDERLVDDLPLPDASARPPAATAPEL